MTLNEFNSIKIINKKEIKTSILGFLINYFYFPKGKYAGSFSSSSFLFSFSVSFLLFSNSLCWFFYFFKATARSQFLSQTF